MLHEEILRDSQTKNVVEIITFNTVYNKFISELTLVH